jgi:hypothetical protein
MTCESCGIENPASAQTCDCGHVLGRPAQLVRPRILIQEIMAPIRRAVFLLPLLGATFAAFDLYSNWDAQKGAPQQAALAGYVLAWAVIPYCFARALAGLLSKD